MPVEELNLNTVDKYTINEQIKDLKDRLNISYNSISSIIYSYRRLILKDLYEGHNFRFGHIAMITCHNKDQNREKSLANYADIISTDNNIPYHVVLGVLNEYIVLTEINIRQGRRFNMVGILRLEPTLDSQGNVTNVYSKLSKSINSSLEKNNCRLRVLNNFRRLIVS